MKNRTWRWALGLGLVSLVDATGVQGAAPTAVRHPEDLFIVDCLLPGKVRSLGRYTKVATPRRVAKLTVHECQLRGGEHSQDLLDNSWALQAWTAQAEAGDVEAMNNVGEIYEQGVRGTPDYQQAAHWYRKAAAAGSRRAQRNWAALLEAGHGVEANPAEALVWYRKAAGLTGDVELSAAREAERLRQELARLSEERLELENRLAEVNRELERAQNAEAESRARISELERAAAQAKQAQVAEQARAERERLAAQRARLEELEAAQERFRVLLAELDAVEAATRKVDKLDAAMVLAKKAPRIEFVQPDILATRGPGIVALPAGAAATELVGRVTSGLEIVSFSLDGAPVTLDRDGYFRVEVPARPGKLVRLVAVDRGARRAEAELQFASGPTSPAHAQVAIQPSPTRATGGKRWALVVANSQYRSFPALETARRDGESIAQVLRDLYGYQVRTLLDGSFLEMMLALEEVARQAGPGDDLLVFYAGHGRLDGTSRGYWIPVDATPDDRSSWLPNEVVTRHLAASRAARVLLVADSCYAGSFAGGGFEAATPGRGQRTRIVLASGGLQPVLDAGSSDGHSVFARALLTVLQLAAEPLSGTALAEAVSARVAWRSAKLGAPQQPVYAPLRHAGHEAGDFLLVPRS